LYIWISIFKKKRNIKILKKLLLHSVSSNVILFDGQRKREGEKTNHIEIQNLKISLFPTTQQSKWTCSRISHKERRNWERLWWNYEESKICRHWKRENLRNARRNFEIFEKRKKKKLGIERKKKSFSKQNWKEKIWRFVDIWKKLGYCSWTSKW
jgi:hypothetical protein